MAELDGRSVNARYHAGLGRIREGMNQLWALYRELEEQDTQASLRATMLKLPSGGLRRPTPLCGKMAGRCGASSVVASPPEAAPP